MNGNELIRKLRRLARRRGVVFRFDPAPGKGGHGEIIFGRRRTFLSGGRQKELGTGLVRSICRQLGIDPSDL